MLVQIPHTPVLSFSLLLRIFLNLISCLKVSHVHVCLCPICMAAACRSQKRLCITWTWNYRCCNSHIGAENWTWVLWTNSQWPWPLSRLSAASLSFWTKPLSQVLKGGRSFPLRVHPAPISIVVLFLSNTLLPPLKSNRGLWGDKPHRNQRHRRGDVSVRQLTHGLRAGSCCSLPAILSGAKDTWMGPAVLTNLPLRRELMTGSCAWEHGEGGRPCALLQTLCEPKTPFLTYCYFLIIFQIYC